MKTVRITLDQALDDAGITRQELAKKTGIQYQTVDNYYKNKVVRYDSKILVKFCDALNCKIEDLLEVK